MNTDLRGKAGTAWTVAAVLALTGAADAVAKDQKAPKASKERHKNESGYIGVYMQDLTTEIREGLDLKVEKGVLVSGVADDSPAAKAGLEEGDVIVAFAGTDVTSPDQLRDIVGEFEPGSDAKLDVFRDGKAKSLTVTVGERPKNAFSFVTPDIDVDVPDGGNFHRAFAVFAGPRLGIEAHEIDNDALGDYFGAKGGVLVLDVEDESVAAKAGVQAGDVIQTIGDEKVEDVGDLRDSVRDFDEGDEFTIGVLRHGKTQSLKATMDEQEQAFFSGDAPMWREWRNGMRAPRALSAPNRNHIQKEINDLKKEIQEMKEQLERQDG